MMSGLTARTASSPIPNPSTTPRRYGDQPEPTPDDEIADIKARIADSEDIERPKVEFEVGETVKINHGAFEGNNGIVEEIDPEKGRLKVTVNIFGRNTPVDVEYWEVDKA